MAARHGRKSLVGPVVVLGAAWMPRRRLRSSAGASSL
jgi:hypothetical protein